MSSNVQSSAIPGVAPLTAARALAPDIRACAEQLERDRRLPPALVRSFAAAGLFRLCVPRAFGGVEADVATLVETIEAVAHADGSAGWCVMIGATSGLISGYLSEPLARDIYASPEAITGGVFAPLGQAVAVDGGYRVSGRWPFASGCEHCNWLMGGAVLLEDDAPRRLPNGMPEARMMLFPSAAAEIIDTWTVSGLRGTGSHDIAVADLYVPQTQSVSLITDRPRQSGPLYAFPVFGVLALGIAAVALGIGRRALDELVALASHKTPSGSRRRLSERAGIQTQVAQAEAGLQAARTFLFATIADTWSAAVAAGEISVTERAHLRLAATHATTIAAATVDAMYGAGGGTSVYATHPLQRCFRDIHVATQHTMVAPATYELTGRILLGLEADTAML